MLHTRSKASRTATAPSKSLPTLLRSSSEPLPPLSTASSISATSPRLLKRPHGFRRSRTSPTQGGKRLGGGGGEAAKAEVSRVVVYAVFATRDADEADEAGEVDVRRCSDAEDETTTRPRAPTSNELASPASSLTPDSPSLALPSPSSSPSLSPRAPPSSPASPSTHILPLPLLHPPSLTAIGIDLARCRLRACTCSPDYDSSETTSSDEDGDEL